MKSTNEVFDAIEHLASLSGKAKEEQLAIYLEFDLFERVVKAALCPFTTYGIKKFTKGNATLERVDGFNDKTWELLDDLAQRNLTGNAAIEKVQVTYEILPDKSAELFERILKKDLRAGFSAKSVNRVKPDTIFVFSCMLAQKYEEKRIKKFPVSVEIKLDGVRVLAMRVPEKTGPYRFFSRTGKEFEAYRHLAEELELLSKDACYVFDGEVVDKSGSFNETVGAAHRKSQAALNAEFHVFDVHNRDAFDKDTISHDYQRRRIALKNIFEGKELSNIKHHPCYKVNSHDEIMHIYNNARNRGLEGVIVKPLNGKYVRKRSYDWLKVKDQQTVDVKIVDMERGTGKFENTMGAIVVDVDGVFVNVGGGFSDALRDEIWNNYNRDWEGRLVEIEFHEKTPDGSLRHPRFIRVRDDKPVEDGVGV